MTRTHFSHTTALLVLAAIAAITIAGCGGGSNAVAPKYGIVASYWTGTMWHPAPARTDVRDGVTGPPGLWEFGVIRATTSPEGVGTCGGTDAPGQCTVYDKAGHEVLPGGKNTWTLVEGDYHVIALDELGRKLAEKWVFADDPTPRLPDPTARHMEGWTCIVEARTTPTAEWRQLPDTGAGGVMVGDPAWEYDFLAYGPGPTPTDAQCKVMDLVTLRDVPAPLTEHWMLPVGWYKLTWQIGVNPDVWPYYTLRVTSGRG